MTARGKIVLTILLLGIVGFGVYRWWDKIAPQSRPQNRSVDPYQVKQEIEQAKAAATAADIPLLAGTNAAELVARSGIPAVTGVSDYSKTTQNGKPVVEFPINVWPGWAPVLVNTGCISKSLNTLNFLSPILPSNLPLLASSNCPKCRVVS
jgi:hypothetical protein